MIQISWVLVGSFEQLVIREDTGARFRLFALNSDVEKEVMCRWQLEKPDFHVSPNLNGPMTRDKYHPTPCRFRVRESFDDITLDRYHCLSASDLAILDSKCSRIILNVDHPPVADAYEAGWNLFWEEMNFV